MDPGWFVETSRLLGSKIDLVVERIVWDDKGVCAQVKPTFPCSNAIPHLTIATAVGVNPVYSNELLSKLRAAEAAATSTAAGSAAPAQPPQASATLPSGGGAVHTHATPGLVFQGEIAFH